MKRSAPSFYHFLGLCILLLTAAACHNDKLIKRGDSLSTAFKKAMAMYQSEDYTNAVKAFKTVNKIGRGTQYGKEGQYYLADSYFKGGRYLQAASEFERYEALYPKSKKRQKAQYREALAYYHLSPLYKLSQKYTKKAIEKFQLYSSRYPNSDQPSKVPDYISELRAKLAHKLFESAKLYQRTDSYSAATIYYDLTIDQYPESIWAQRALVQEIKTYNTYASKSVPKKKKGRYTKALDAYEKFIQLFPDGKYRSKAEGYVDKTRSALAGIKGSSESGKSTASADVSSAQNR